MAKKTLFQQVLDTIRKKNLTTFRTRDFGCLKNSPAYLSKHSNPNGQHRQYFVRVDRGLYKLKDSSYLSGMSNTKGNSKKRPDKYQKKLKTDATFDELIGMAVKPKKISKK
jgi:hypothetical protein